MIGKAAPIDPAVPSSRPLHRSLRPLAATLIVVGFALGGAVAGALLMRGERWEGIPLDQLRVSLPPQRDGIALGVSVRF